MNNYEKNKKSNNEGLDIKKRRLDLIEISTKKKLTRMEKQNLISLNYKSSRGPLRIQKRDILVLWWILEMKFSNFDAIYKKFFNTIPSVAYRRISRLAKCGYLKSILSLGEKQTLLYLITPYGYSVLRSYVDSNDILAPVTYVSLLTLSHDLMVLNSRVKLEELGIVNNWRAERIIQSEMCKGRKLTKRDHIPDGIFYDKNNKAWAFELEASLKGKERLRKQIQHYKKLMSDPSSTFSSCLFVYTNKSIRKAVTACVGSYAEHFKIISYEEIMSGGINL